MIEAAILAHWLYAKECCEGQDCRPVPCAEIRDVGNGWVWHDMSFSRAQLRLSPDGTCHVCVRYNVTYCIYLPPMT